MMLGMLCGYDAWYVMWLWCLVCYVVMMLGMLCGYDAWYVMW